MVSLLTAFVIGGVLCALGQIIMDFSRPVVTPGHILVGYVTGGAILSALGLYQPLIDIGGAGATIPLSGFGHSLAQGAIASVKADGLLGAFSGGIQATAVGIAAAVVFGFTMAVLFNPKG
ncbi:MAG: stage V sporulation protein AE [Syntrophomonadaceae bacterium]|nr:stage V sporulation protein AE [Syntrophomonadaceae bacterium]